MFYSDDIKRVKGILAGRFSNPSDRQYWENKLTDLQNKQASAEDNYKKLQSYNEGTDFTINRKYQTVKRK